MITQKEKQYNRTPKRMEYMRVWQEKYRKSDKGKKYFKEYNSKPEVKERQRKHNREYLPKWYQAHKDLPEFKLNKKEYDKKRRILKRDKLKAQEEKYRKSPIGILNNKKRIKKYMQTEKGRALHTIMHNKRREAQNSVITSYSKNDWLNIKRKTEGNCPCCKKYVGLNNISLDHIYPLTKAKADFLKTGTKRIYTSNDIQALCRSCNSSKYNK